MSSYSPAGCHSSALRIVWSIARAYDSRLEAPLNRSARRSPSQTAVIAGDGTIDYATLERRSSALARRLAALGVGAGERVATTLPAGLEFAALVHALPMLGAVLVPINTRLPAPD